MDPALLRSGRFDKIIHITSPTIKGRRKLIEYYLKDKNTAKNLSLDYLARITMNLNGSDIKNIVNIALMNAIKH